MAAIGVAKEDRKYIAASDVGSHDSERAHSTSLRECDRFAAVRRFRTFRATAFYLYLSAAGKYSKLAEFSLN